MALKLGATTLTALYLGSTAIATAYLGSTEVYTTGGAFSPASLFASGEEGAWYEPSTSTAFLSTTDLTPCDYGDACGFLLDKSQGAGYSGGSFTGLGTELVENGNGTSIEGWTVGSPVLFSVNGSNQFEVSRNSGAATDLPQQSILTSGRRYLVSFDVIALSNDVSIYAGEPASIGSPNVFVTSSTGSFSVIVLATGTDFHIGATNSLTATATIDNISVRELPGNHATQVTAGARPILARVPPRGRVNELSETDTLATQSVTVTAEQRTLSFKGTGTVTLSGASTAGPLVGTGAEDRVSLTFTPSSGTLTLTVSGAVTDAQLELGSAVTNYQFVADLLGYDITEAGVTSLEYLSFDGSDDFLVTGNDHPFSFTGPVSLFSGFRKLGTTKAYETLFAVGATGLNTANVGKSMGFQITDLGNNRLATDIWRPSGVRGSTTLTSPLTAVASFNIANWSTHRGGGTDIRLNGVDETEVAYDTDNPAALNTSKMYVGVFDTVLTSSFFNGHMYGLVVRNASSTTGEITNTETYLAAKSGVVL